MTMNSELRPRVRPWTQVPVLRRRREKVNITMPTVDTYRQHMENVQSLYKRLRLADHGQSQTSISSAGLPALVRPRMKRSHTFAAALRPSRSSGETPFHERMWAGENMSVFHRSKQPRVDSDTKTSQSGDRTLESSDASPPLVHTSPVSHEESGNVKYVGRKYGWVSSSTAPPNAEPLRKTSREEASSSGVSSKASSDRENVDKDWFRSTDKKPDGILSQEEDTVVDILQLCHHLKTHGLGEPVMSTHSHTGLHTHSLPPGVRARCLPRDPSTREKIKGRARLDYELANLRAEAFCEQQRSRAFRTASADLRNRDVRLLEEEERENVHKDLVAAEADRHGVLDETEEDDDDSSLVGSPLSREELFFRIEAWAEDVHKALNRGHS